MPEQPFSNRELTAMFNNIDEKLDAHSEVHEKILKQVLFTNGKVRKLYLWLTIVGSVTGTLFAMNGSQLVGFILKIML